MPTVYNTFTYGEKKYSLGDPCDRQGYLFYGNCIAGIEVRGQIGHKKIYRVRPGNGYYGSEIGVRYQDRYNYFVPSTIMHPAGDASRTCFANAVAAWKALSDAEKEEWKYKARNYKAMPGRNLFIRDYMLRNY